MGHGDSTLNYTESGIAQCLKGKRVFSIGDSFLRQYQSLFADYLAIKRVSNRVSIVAVSKKTNILLYWRTHEMPYQNCALINPEKSSS